MAGSWQALHTTITRIMAAENSRMDREEDEIVNNPTRDKWERNRLARQHQVIHALDAKIQRALDANVPPR